MESNEKLPIRILHMIGSLNIGGSQAMVMNLYRKIDRTKIQFDFIIDRPDELFYAEEIERLGGRIYVLPTFNGANYFSIKKNWNSFFSKHDEYKILHSHIRSYASIFIPIAKKHGLKTIIHSHSTSNGSGLNAILKTVLQFPLRFQADYFFACSNEAAKWLFGKQILKKRNFKLMKNSIDSTRFSNALKSRLEDRKKLGLNDVFTLGFLARVTNAKNPMFALEVFYYYNLLNKKSKMLFVGDGPLLNEVKDKAKKMNIYNNIVFTGERSDVEKMFSVMDFYVFPSLWEGLGISLIEAQASGLNCVCSENIQDEAIFTKNVTKLNLSVGAKKWAKTIYNIQNNIRTDNNELVKKAGFDIADNVNALTSFYTNLYNEKFEVDL